MLFFLFSEKRIDNRNKYLYFYISHSEISQDVLR